MTADFTSLFAHLARRIRIVVQLVRPFTMLAPGIGFLAAGLMAVGRSQSVLWERVWPLLVLGAAAAALLNAASNGLNQVYDVEIDRINKPNRPLAANRLTRSQAMVISLVLYALTLALAARLGLTSFALFVVAAGATVLYSVPPVRTKQRGWLANLSIAVPRGVLLKVAGWSVVMTALTPEPWYIGLIFGIFLFGASATKDLADVEGDRLYQCATLPVMYGARRATLLIAPFFVFPWLLLPLGSDMGILHLARTSAWILALLLAAWGCLIAFNMVRGAASTGSPQVPWVHMYLMLVAAQLGLAAAYLMA